MIMQFAESTTLSPIVMPERASRNTPWLIARLVPIRMFFGLVTVKLP